MKHSGNHDKKVIGQFINRLREELKISLPIETLLVLKGMEGGTKTVARLKDSGIKTMGQLADMDYDEILSILGRNKSEYLVMVMGLYNFRRCGAVHHRNGEKDDVATTEIVSG